MKSARASADGPDSEQQPAWSWATCLRASSFHYRTNVEVCSPTLCRAKPFPSKPGDVAGRAEWAALESTLRPFNRARTIVESRSPAGAVLL